MVELRVTKKDGVASIDLPVEMLDRLGVSDGASIYAAETSDGIVLTARNVDVAQQMRIANAVMARYDDVLRKLAQ